jgi:hypothetical protein
MICNIIESFHAAASPVLDDFEEAIHNQHLHFLASTFENIGFQPPDQISQAVERAIRICNNCGLPAREHFKLIYIADDSDHTVRMDWRLSKFGYLLVMLNGTPDNPAVAHAQLEMLRKYL